MHSEWLQALSRLTYGIYVLTSATAEAANGMIASWVSQVSYDPPLIMVGIHPNRYTHALVEQSGVFALHALRTDQQEHLRRFKERSPQDKLHGLGWHFGETGAPVLDDCLAWLECRVRQTLRPGNHTLFFGEVQAARSLDRGEPLTILAYQGTYLGRE